MNKDIWDKVKRPPESALKTIGGGRLKGMTDISPQWRYEVMTEIFGPCGVGWKYEIENLWTLPGSDDQVVAFAQIGLYVAGKSSDGKWSEKIPGIGGSMLVTKEKAGLNTSDEAYKMAVTDALSVAMKQLGVGADIYMGKFDGSKYKDDPKAPDKEAEDAAYRIVTEKYADSILAIKTGIKDGQLSVASEAWFELSDDVKAALWKAPTKGGCFTTGERTIMRSPEFRTANSTIPED